MKDQKENSMSMCGICKREPGKPYQVGIYTKPSHHLAYTQVRPRLLRYSTQYVCDRCVAADRRKDLSRLKLWWIPVIFMGLLLALGLIRGYDIQNIIHDDYVLPLLVVPFLLAFVFLLVTTIMALRQSHTKRGKEMAGGLIKKPPLGL